MNNIPPEILNHIFRQLPASDLVRCRAVCFKWREIIDELTCSEILWRNMCYLDFPDICESAYRKSSPRLTWSLLYRSLKLWPKLQSATQTTESFAAAEYIKNEIISFVLLNNNIIGVHRIDNIVYYDYNTLQKKQWNMIVGHVYDYIENENLFVVQRTNHALEITGKTSSRTSFSVTECKNVTNFTVSDNVIYYITRSTNLHKCEYINLSFTKTEITSVPTNFCNGALALVIQGRSLYILVSWGIYKLFENQFVAIVEFRPSTALATVYHELIKYNFLQNKQWLTFLKFYAYREPACFKYLKLSLDFSVILSYGYVTFAGTCTSKVYVFYSPNINNFIDLYTVEPLKIYDFTPMHGGSIIQIEVVEGVDSHRVYVAMPTRIVVVKITHEFTRTALQLKPSSSGGFRK